MQVGSVVLCTERQKLNSTFNFVSISNLGFFNVTFSIKNKIKAYYISIKRNSTQKLLHWAYAHSSHKYKIIMHESK